MSNLQVKPPSQTYQPPIQNFKSNLKSNLKVKPLNLTSKSNLRSNLKLKPQSQSSKSNFKKGSRPFSFNQNCQKCLKQNHIMKYLISSDSAWENCLQSCFNLPLQWQFKVLNFLDPFYIFQFKSVCATYLTTIDDSDQSFLSRICINNRFLRKRSMGSNTKMEYQVFLRIFKKIQNKTAIVILFVNMAPFCSNIF